jgi:hypothetical protein
MDGNDSLNEATPMPYRHRLRRPLPSFVAAIAAPAAEATHAIAAICRDLRRSYREDRCRCPIGTGSDASVPIHRRPPNPVVALVK